MATAKVNAAQYANPARFYAPEDYRNQLRSFTYTNLTYSELELAYILNPATNLKLFGSYSVRNTNGGYSEEDFSSSNFFYFGVKTDLRNIYYDF